METWIVSVAGQAYGPYSTAQMEAFAAEGRIVAHSLVAQPGDTTFRPAGDEPALSGFFKPTEFVAQPASTISSTAGAQPYRAEESSGKFGRHTDEGQEGVATRFLVITDMKSGSIAGVEEELFRLGPCCVVFPQVWIVQSDLSVTGVKNLLIQKLGKLDVLFVADTTHDKAAWFNFSPEAETRIRRAWTRPQDAPAKRKSA